MNNFQNVKLQKSMYNVAGKPFSELLETMDPSSSYQDSSLAKLDAYERQLKRFDIKISGSKSDTIEKFFSSTDSASLFPEYVLRAVKSGVDDQSILNNIVATKTNIDSLDYRTIYSNPSSDQKELKFIAEGSSIPQTNIALKHNLIKLHKTGRLLVSSYEALRFQKLDLFTVALKQIGNHISSSQLKQAVDVLINGDGNANPAEVIAIKKDGKPANAPISYNDLITLWSKFDDFHMNTLLVSPKTMCFLLNIDEFKNPNSGLNFQKTGTLSTPLGANLFKSSAVPDNTIIALDSDFALEMVCSGDVCIEYDKLIDRQLERAAITSTAGFSKICADAVKVLRLS
jgi:hypothetical protein